MRDGQVIFTYFHFAADERLTHRTLECGCIAVAYETVQLPTGELPLLTPMSEVAGRMAIQQAAKNLERVAGGYGILLGGVPGVLPAEVVILGGGVVGDECGDDRGGFRRPRDGPRREPPAAPVPRGCHARQREYGSTRTATRSSNRSNARTS